MTDLSTDTLRRSDGSRRRNAEFNLYFALIFLLALPGGTIGWVRDVIRKKTLNLHGPLARAWAEADRMTPLIFSA